MPISISKNLRWFLIYFISLLLIGLFIRDTGDQYDVFLNVKTFLKTSLISHPDPKSFVIGALDIYENGWVTDKNLWLVRVWPPGFMILEGIVLKLFGVNAPFIFILIMINTLLYSFFLLLFRGFLLNYISDKFASVFPLLPFSFPMIRVFLLEPLGIVFGEGFSIVFFLIAIFLILKSNKNFSWKITIFAGIFFALSAYFRSSFELIISSLSLFAIFYSMFYFTFLKRGEHSVLKIKNLLAALIFANVLMMPWRHYHYNEPFTKTLAWSTTSEIVYRDGSMLDKDLINAGSKWLVIGGATIPCKLDSSYCNNPNKEEFYRIFKENIIEWSVFKFKIFDDYWFASLKDFGYPRFPSTFFDYVENALFLVFFILNLILFFLTRKVDKSQILFLQYFSFCTATLMISIVVHLEVRYFFAMKIFAVFIFIALLSMYWHLLLQRKATHKITF